MVWIALGGCIVAAGVGLLLLRRDSSRYVVLGPLWPIRLFAIVLILFGLLAIATGMGLRSLWGIPIRVKGSQGRVLEEPAVEPVAQPGPLVPDRPQRSRRV